MTLPGRRSRAAIIGVGTTEQGTLTGRSANEIAVDALALAMTDAGITDKSEIDGLITCRSFGGSGIDTQIGPMIGLNPAFSATLDYGTCNFSLHLAMMALESGLASTIAIMYGTNQRSSGNRFRATPGAEDFGAPYGFFNVAGPAALAFARHQYLYGTTERQLGEVAVAFRQNAQLNPLAIFTKELSIEDYLASRYIVRPLRRPDICMISDGGACLILTTAERAQDRAQVPVHVVGAAEQTGLRNYQNADQLMRPWIAAVAERVYADAGLSRTDVDVLYIQDPTSIWVLQMLEWYGFCPVGEGGRFLEGGRIALGGELPVNTNGGQLSEAYMWGWLHLCEAVRQLRGSCGERQVPGVRIAQYCSTMGFLKAASSILAVDR
jgi:acetyl-CoA acetyltransferase